MISHDHSYHYPIFFKIPVASGVIKHGWILYTIKRWFSQLESPISSGFPCLPPLITYPAW